MTDSTATAPSADTAPPAAAHPWWRGTAGLALMVVLGLLLGAGGAWLTHRLRTPGDDSPEAGFARDMLNHHAQAVEMGLVAYRGSGDAEVRSGAVDIVMTQLTEAGMLQAWLRDWDVPPTSTDPPMSWLPAGKRHLTPDGRMPGMADAQELDRLRTASGRARDVLFLQLMIRHHLGGTHMIAAILDSTDEPEVRRAATAMRDVQSAEVKNMTALLTRLGGAPLPSS
ncbi:MAG TPA: DUF305 domain-containing protein [Pilimelia sp.]|nr:DUF305 domain-containing protein [Pilimelia sp.]